MKLELHETDYESIAQGPLTEGCEQCVEGKKLVLFVTGVCPAKCFYCPLSPEKKMRDVVFANERELTGDDAHRLQQLFEEVRMSGAEGAGITGGDPLARLGRTCEYIRALKKEFGKDFHIHLYTTPLLVTEDSLSQLFDAGLDEIRFHPLDDEEKWSRLLLARRFSWKVGIEIPVLPDKIDDAKKLLLWAGKNKLIDFLNLNELEVSELTADEFQKKHYHVREESGYGVDGCKEAALEIMKLARTFDVPVHYCTTTLKDKYQMGNRLRRQAAQSAQAFDVVEEGLLFRGAIYHDFPPGENYQRVLKTLTPQERKNELAFLEKVVIFLKELGMPEDAGFIDELRLRIVLGAEALHELADDLSEQFPELVLAVVTEYPTSDAWIVEFNPIPKA
ncbi:radical SAM protein [Candidatus Woesearchaeota archaeon]|nr:radical SAM protein [Candidatus Woesearchaeota archaeon]